MSRLELSCEEMLAAHSQVLHDSMAYVGSICLKVAIELGIPEIISAHGRPMSKADLISKLGSIPHRKADSLVRVLRLLAQMGYFKIKKHSNSHIGSVDDEEDETIFYSLTPLSIMLLEENLSASVLYAANPRQVNMFQFLSQWFTSGGGTEGVHDFVEGKLQWELANESPEHNSLFNVSMACETRLLMKWVVEHYKDAFKGLRSIVDVGGGTGTASHVIAEAFPGVKCIVYDLPHVISSVPESSVIEAVGGDMFEHVPRADAILLKVNSIELITCHRLCVIDKQVIIFVATCTTRLGRRELCEDTEEAISVSGGKVIIVDMVLNDDEASTELVGKLISDITMMTFLGGKEREEHEWEKIFSEAGFTNYKINPVGAQSLIELFL